MRDLKAESFGINHTKKHVKSKPLLTTTFQNTACSRLNFRLPSDVSHCEHRLMKYSLWDEIFLLYSADKY